MALSSHRLPDGVPADLHQRAYTQVPVVQGLVHQALLFADKPGEPRVFIHSEHVVERFQGHGAAEYLQVLYVDLQVHLHFAVVEGVVVVDVLLEQSAQRIFPFLVTHTRVRATV